MLIRDEVLRADFQPTEILHRHDELEALSSALEPVRTGDRRPSTGAFLYGLSGVGKTTSARYVVDELREATAIQTATVNCWESKTSREVIHAILSDLEKRTDRPTPGTSTAGLLEDLEQAIDEPVVVVLDEADQLTDERALYQCYELEGLVPIIIANRKHEWLSRLDTRVSSRVESLRTIRFLPYTDAELVGILEARVRAAAGANVIDGDALERIGSLADGDARKAIATLREVVQQIGPEFDGDDVPEVMPAVNAALREASLEKMGERQRLVYEVLEEIGEDVAISTVYDRYADRVRDPHSERSVREDLRKLADYGLVERIGDNRGRRYRAVPVDDAV